MNVTPRQIAGAVAVVLSTALCSAAPASAQGGPYPLSPTQAALAGPAGAAPRGMLLPHINAPLPTDTASNYGQGSDYTQTYGGQGFSNNWTHFGNGGAFTDSSNHNGSGAGPGIDSTASPNQSFGLYSSGGTGGVVYRTFNSALTTGDAFHIDFDNGYLDGGATEQYQLTSSGSNSIAFGFNGGDTSYFINDATGPHSTGLPYTDRGVSTQVFLTGANSYTLQAAELANGTTYTYSYNGTFTGSLNGITVLDTQTTSGKNPSAPYNLYFNNVSVSPEPNGAVAILTGAAALGGVIAARRRRTLPD